MIGVLVLPESRLRDLLAENLSVIEPGLRLVGKEFRLPNAHGTRGSIDLLARDPHGLYVVIEIKRSEGPARQAIHEVAKYTELLRREMHLAPDRIRAIIVSVEWDELLAPVSNFARDWSHDLRGYRLCLTPDGTIARVERVTLLPEPFDHRLTPIHFIYFFDSPEDREKGWQHVLRCAREVGAWDLVGVDLDYVGPPKRVQAPYALYLALGRMDPELVAPELKRYDADELESIPYAREHPLEYQALCHICSRVFAVTAETADPGVFAKLVGNPNWRIDTDNIRGSDVYAHSGLREERDIIRALSGHDGDGQVLFTGSANPKIARRWAAFLTETQTSLAGNEDWTKLVRYWLDEVATHPTDSDVMLHVYNPCDLIQTLIYAWPDRLEKYVPMLLGLALRRDAPHRRIRGGLYWNGIHVPDLADRVRLVYRDPYAWLAARYGGIAWYYDQMLTEALGLRYVIFEEVFDTPITRGGDEQTALLMVRDGQPQRITEPFDELLEEGWQGAYMLDRFLVQHLPQVDALVRQYRYELGFQPPPE